MAVINIYVGRRGNSTQLSLSDSEGHNPGNDDLDTQIGTNDTIIWNINSNNPIASIDDIQPKAGNDNILKANPSKVNGVWTANAVATDPSPGRPKFYSYSIYYYLPNDTKRYNDDPKLNMN